MTWLGKSIILCLIRRSKNRMRIWGEDIDITNIYRYCPFWYDEWTDNKGEKHCRPPWYRPFNIFLHRWVNDDGELMHDHPRWSITICLRGVLIEETPWERRVLTPGRFTIRSHKYIHRFRVGKGHRGKTWTLFIVGRRSHLQNDYRVIPYDQEY